MENTTQNSQITALLERCKLFLDDGDFQSAVQYANKILDVEPACAEAYALLLCAKAHVRSEEVLVYADCDISEFPEYEKMVRFSTGEAKNRRENYPKEAIYVRATGHMREKQFAAAIDEFDKITDYKDADNLAKECDTARKELIYSLAVKAETEKNYDAAQKMFLQIPGYSDASERAEQSRCVSVYAKAAAAENKNDYKTAIELYSEIKAYKDSQDRIAKLLILIKKNASDRKLKTVIAMISVSVCVLPLLIVFVFVPAGKNFKARKLLAEGEYDEAVAIFRDIDSTKGICSVAETFVTLGDYDAAADLYKSIHDTTEGVRSVAETYITLDNYDMAVALYNSIDDTEGIQAMLDLANKSFAEADYIKAAALYVSLNDVNGMQSIIYSANKCLASKEYSKALELYTSISVTDGVRAVANAFKFDGDDTSMRAVNAIAELIDMSDDARDVRDVQEILKALDAASDLPAAKKCAEVIRNKLKEIEGAYEYDEGYSDDPSIRRYEFESDGSYRYFNDYESHSEFDDASDRSLYVKLNGSLTEVTWIASMVDELKFTSYGVTIDENYYIKVKASLQDLF